MLDKILILIVLNFILETRKRNTNNQLFIKDFIIDAGEKGTYNVKQSKNDTLVLSKQLLDISLPSLTDEPININENNQSLLIIKEDTTTELSILKGNYKNISDLCETINASLTLYGLKDLKVYYNKISRNIDFVVTPDEKWNVPVYTIKNTSNSFLLKMLCPNKDNLKFNSITNKPKLILSTARDEEFQLAYDYNIEADNAFTSLLPNFNGNGFKTIFDNSKEAIFTKDTCIVSIYSDSAIVAKHNEKKYTYSGQSLFYPTILYPVVIENPPFP